MESHDTLLAAVIGWPIKHSLSPALHGFWLRQYKIDGAVVPLLIKPENFADCLNLLPKLGFKGAWITLPYKEIACRVADECDETARTIGAANTLVFRDGRIFGRNTDAYGFRENLLHQQPGLDLKGTTAALIGAGGAARAVLHALLELGCRRIFITNRTASRADQLAEDFKDRGVPLEKKAWGTESDWINDAGFVVNATNLGMDGQPPLPFCLDNLPRGAIVADIVYRPLMTSLLKAAQDRSHPIVTGLGMLIHQGRPGFKEFFGEDPQTSPELEQWLLGKLRRR